MNHSNIILGHNYIYAMKVVALSSLFRVMTFAHEGHLITIDLNSLTMIPHTILHLKIPHHTCGLCKLHAQCVHHQHQCRPTPIECETIALVPPPPHFSLEVGWAHPLLKEPTSHVSLIYDSNFASTPIKSDNITSFHGQKHSPHSSSSIDGFNVSTNRPSNYIFYPPYIPILDCSQRSCLCISSCSHAFHSPINVIFLAW